ncbi:MAG: YbjN domain-containing protein [Synechococcales bacterium]|nr:YbjN domain-containing protein [Synechococcales bacterium]
MTTFNLQSESFSDDQLLDEKMFSTGLIDMIETVISSLEQDESAMVSHTEQGHLWKFRYGTVEVYVRLTGTTDEDTFTVWSTLLNLPDDLAKQTPLMKKLLSMNWAETFEASFCLLGDEVVIAATRAVAELSPGEISRNITVVATIADEQDELLRDEFGLS